MKTEDFIKMLKTRGEATVVVINPYDEATILSLHEALKINLVKDVVAIGDVSKIQETASKLKVDVSKWEFIDEKIQEKSSNLAAQYVSKNRNCVLMKGLVDTSIMLRAVLNKGYGLRTNKMLSHVAVVYQKNDQKYYIISDAGINITPDLNVKKHIIENSVELAHALGNKNPKVALLCAKEKPYDKMPATLDAQKLKEMNENNEITGCVVSGPLQIDNAINMEAAKIKGVTDPVAGKAKILITPNIESGNIFAKGIKYMGLGYSFTGIVMGAKIPIVLTSRADNYSEKLTSLVLVLAVDAHNE